MAHARDKRIPAAIRPHAENQEHLPNVSAGWVLTPLVFERFDLVAARCELNCAHRAFRLRRCRFTYRRLLQAIRRHRALIGVTDG
jgi:hypothetical protein